MKITNQKIEYKNTIQTSNEKIDQAQTWSEYLYPYFTSEYYYVGQVATTVAVVTTAAVVYWYIAPAVASYYYGNNSSNNTPTNDTHNIHTSNQIDEITETPTIINKIINKENTIEYSEYLENILGHPVYINIPEAIKNNADLKERVCNKILKLIENDELDTYIQDINNGKYTNQINKFFKEYDKEKIENNELLIPEVLYDIKIIEELQKNVINTDVKMELADQLMLISEKDLDETILTEELEEILNSLMHFIMLNM